jgi:hypothetical protein
MDSSGFTPDLTLCAEFAEDRHERSVRPVQQIPRFAFGVSRVGSYEDQIQRMLFAFAGFIWFADPQATLSRLQHG